MACRAVVGVVGRRCDSGSEFAAQRGRGCTRTLGGEASGMTNDRASRALDEFVADLDELQRVAPEVRELVR